MKKLRDLLLVREGETANVIYFLSFFLLVSAGMAIGRGSADALLLKRLGFEYLPVMYMIQALLLAMVCLVYAAFADRIIAERSFRMIFSTLALLVFAGWVAMSLSESTLVYALYYLVYEVASEILLVHAMLYMNQNMTTLQAKRLAPLVFAGAQTGSIIGGLVLAFAAPALGTQNLLVLWCILLAAGILLVSIWHRRHGPSTHFRAPHRSASIVKESTRQVTQGLRYTLSSDLLRAASLALFFMVITFYILCYSVHRVYTLSFEAEAALASFYGVLTAVTSAIALLVQVFITGRVIRRFGVRRVNLFFPWTTLVVLSILTVSFTLPAAILGSLNKDALMPAFRNPVRSLFFNVIPDYMQGRARAISVAVVLPGALFVCGLLLWIMQGMERPEYFLVPGMAAAFMYMYSNRNMNLAYAGTLIKTLQEKLFLPDKRLYSALNGANREIFDEITAGLAHRDPDVAIAFARLLTGSFPEQAAALLLDRVDSADDATADQLLRLLADIDLSNYREILYALAETRDAHFHATVVRLLASQKDGGYLEQALQLMESSNPRLCAAGIHYVLHSQEASQDPEYLVRKWRGLLQDSTSACKAAFTLIPDLPLLEPEQWEQLQGIYNSVLTEKLEADSKDMHMCTLRGLSQWKAELPDGVYAALSRALVDENPEMRSAAARCLHLGDHPSRSQDILRATADSHPHVSQAGVDSLKATSNNFVEEVYRLIQDNEVPMRGQFVLLAALVEAGLPRSGYEQLASNKAREASRFQDAIQVLGSAEESGSTTGTLVRMVLEERLEQTVQLALMALEPLHAPGTIETIRAGFSSQDERHIANAAEALGNLEGDNEAIKL
ncbi:MAG: MFS transporter, partial [Gammaproteobacteria bacterium]